MLLELFSDIQEWSFWVLVSLQLRVPLLVSARFLSLLWFCNMSQNLMCSIVRVPHSIRAPLTCFHSWKKDAHHIHALRLSQLFLLHSFGKSLKLLCINPWLHGTWLQEEATQLCFDLWISLYNHPHFQILRYYLSKTEHLCSCGWYKQQPHTRPNYWVYLV